MDSSSLAASDCFLADTFATMLSATTRDDGEVWLDLDDGLRVRASYSTPFTAAHGRNQAPEPNHKPGKFPATVWNGVVEFRRTDSGLWLLTLPATGHAFTMVAWPEQVPDRGAEKVCAGCYVSRPVGMFTRNPRNADGLQRRCVDCCKVAKPPIGKSSRRRSPGTRSRRRVTPAARALANAITPSPMGRKTCPCCVKSKPARRPFFVVDHRTKDGLQHLCAECSETVPALMWLQGIKKVV
jgi:hypothetical protein